jgi:hypothetical protein
MKLKSGDQGNIFYKSSSPFEFYDIFNGDNEKNQEVFGTLVFPETKKGYISFSNLYAWKYGLGNVIP